MFPVTVCVITADFTSGTDTTEKMSRMLIQYLFCRNNNCHLVLGGINICSYGYCVKFNTVAMVLYTYYGMIMYTIKSEIMN